jgi:hypothetical protein
MTALAVFFVAVGVADACGRLTRTRWLPLALAPIVVIACAALAGLWHRGDIPLLAIAAATGVGWLLLCARAEETGAHLGAPLALFAGTVGLLIVLSAGTLGSPVWSHTGRRGSSRRESARWIRISC